MENDEEKNEININSNNESEKKKIFNKIVNKSLLCSKSTVELASNIIDNIVSMNKSEMFKLTENGLPDDLLELRSLVWKINLDYLTPDWNQWNRYLDSKRTAYKNYRAKIIKDLEKELDSLKAMIK